MGVLRDLAREKIVEGLRAAADARVSLKQAAATVAEQRLSQAATTAIQLGLEADRRLHAAVDSTLNEVEIKTEGYFGPKTMDSARRFLERYGVLNTGNGEPEEVTHEMVDHLESAMQAADVEETAKLGNE